MPELNYQWLADLSEENGGSLLNTFLQVLSEHQKTAPKTDYDSLHMGRRMSPEEILAGEECYVGSSVVAKFLGISPRTLCEWCENHRIAHYQPDPSGGKILFRLSEVKADMEKMRIQSKWR